ncbi:MAG: substrate-binding domain-containing protein [Planctomycetia bacterium]|nr:substrate-binding domain-containing protein [Planctomycetia bacterium]
MGWKKKVLLFVETSRCYGRNIIYGVSRRVAENRNWTLYFQDRGVWEEVPESIEKCDCDGIISRCSSPAIYNRLRSLNVPLIELLGDEETFFPAVKNDERTNCRMAADHFLGSGFRHFAFFAVSDTPWARVRQRFFHDALLGRPTHCESYDFFSTGAESALSQSRWGWWQGNETEILAWLHSLPKPVAILCEWDMSAFFLINICNNNGVMIPEEVAILGYGNNADLCISSSPSLSSVVSNGREVGYQAAILLEKKFQNQPLPNLPLEIPATHIAVRQSTQRFGADDPIVAHALGFIRENIAMHPNVSEVAKNAGVSSTTLCRLFRKKLNRSPEEEIIRCCMNWAKELLAETDFPISKIAHFLQYSSVASFARTFRRETGTTPSQFREKARQ